MTVLYIVNLAEKIYNVRHAWTLNEISRTRVGVHTADNNEPALHKWKTMGLMYSKIVTFGPIRKQLNLTFGQLGIVRKFKGG